MFGIIKNIIFYRYLILELTKRDFAGKYRGSLGGLAWALVQPVGLLILYTIAFGVILKAKWGFGGGVDNYAIMIFLGLICFNAFSEVIGKSPFLIINTPNYVKKVVFPLEVLSIATVLSTMGHFVISLVIWQTAYSIVIGGIHLYCIYLPILLLIYLFFLMGISLLLSSAAVFFKDISQLIGFIAQATLFLSTIFYSIEAAPEYLQEIIKLNPLTIVVDQFRWIAYYGHKPVLKVLLVQLLCSGIFFCIALLIFNRAKKYFADWI